MFLSEIKKIIADCNNDLKVKLALADINILVMGKPIDTLTIPNISNKTGNIYEEYLNHCSLSLQMNEVRAAAFSNKEDSTNPFL